MTSLATESLSPLFKNATVRRGSLEICQKLGNRLLSPRNSPVHTSASPEKLNPNNLSAFLTTAKSAGSHIFSFCNDHNEGLFTNRYQRRASDSSWIDNYSLTANPSEKPNSRPRRHSLTPQHPSLLSRDRGKGSSKTTREKYSRKPEDSRIPTIICSLIPPSPPEQAIPTSNNEETIIPFRSSLLNVSQCSESFNEDVTDDASNSHVNHESLSQENIQYSGKKNRRCSSEVKYEVDEGLVSFVGQHLNLKLNPDELLGKGSFGTVVGGIYQGKGVAIKVLKTTNAQRKASVHGESNALDLPCHNHIARVIDVFQLESDRALIVMDKMHKGNLLGLLNDPCITMNCNRAIQFSKQIALGLIFCHRHSLIHLDVKPQNVLLDNQNCCKLSDFGSSRKINELDASNNNIQLAGTVPYTAPELFSRSLPTTKCDVYSLAITMWQILTRETPYQNENEHTVIFRVVAQGLRPNQAKDQINQIAEENESEKNLISQFTKLYEDSWHSDPAKRPSMNDIHQRLIKIQLLG